MRLELLTGEDRESLRTLGVKTLSSTTWSPEQIHEAYRLTNIVYDMDKADSGCSSCRRGTIDLLKRAFRALPTVELVEDTNDDIKLIEE
jgi:hypothetical protein